MHQHSAFGQRPDHGGDLALRRLDPEPMSREEALALRGRGSRLGGRPRRPNDSDVDAIALHAPLSGLAVR
jgi:hypothetical protein